MARAKDWGDVPEFTHVVAGVTKTSGFILQLWWYCGTGGAPPLRGALFL